MSQSSNQPQIESSKPEPVSREDSTCYVCCCCIFYCDSELSLQEHMNREHMQKDRQEPVAPHPQSPQSTNTSDIHDLTEALDSVPEAEQGLLEDQQDPVAPRPQSPQPNITPDSCDLTDATKSISEAELSVPHIQTESENANENLVDMCTTPSSNQETKLDDLSGASSSVTWNIPINSNSKRRYKCSECTQIFHWHGDLAEHLRQAHNIARQARNSTRVNRNGRGSLGSNGLKRFGGKSSGGPFACMCCRYEAKYESELKRHMRLHYHSKPFKCDFCDYKSAWKGDLKRHIESHHKDKFETSEDLARIMSKFKNNAGTIPIEKALGFKRDHYKTSPQGTYSGETSMSQSSPPIPSTSLSSLPIPQTSFKYPPYATSSDISSSVPQTSEAGCPIAPIPFPNFPVPSISDVSSLLNMPFQTTSNASLPNPTVSFSSPLMPPEGLRPSTPIDANLASPILDMMERVKNWRHPLSPEQILALQFSTGLPIQPLGASITELLAKIQASVPMSPQEKPVQEAQRPSISDDQPLNLVCREGILPYNQSSTSGSHSHPAKRRATNRPEYSERFSNSSNSRETKSKPFMCSGCGHRSNWKWDVNKHIDLAHPNRTGLQIITLAEEDAVRTLPEYMEKMRLYGRNGRLRDDPNSEPQGREGYVRRFLCPACGHRSNWKWDVRKHMQNIHGREYDVYELSIDLALQTLKDYLERKKRGQSVVMQDSEDPLNVPTTSAQAYASDISGEGGSPENNIAPESVGDYQSMRDDDVVDESNSIAPCPACRAIFPCVGPLSLHMEIVHQSTLESSEVSMPPISPSGSMPPEIQPEPELVQKASSPLIFTPAQPAEDQPDSENVPVGSKRAFPECRLEEAVRLTPDSTTSSGSFVPINRPRIRPRRSQVASSATQTQSPAPLTTLDNMIPIEESSPNDASLCQLADLLKQTTDYLTALLHVPNLDSQPGGGISQSDENTPSSSVDRTEYLASLLMHPQVQRLTDQLLPLLQRVKERVENTERRGANFAAQSRQ